MRKVDRIKRIVAWVMVGIMLFGTVAMLIGMIVSADTVVVKDSGDSDSQTTVSTTLLKVWDKHRTYYDKDEPDTKPGGKPTRFQIKEGYHASFQVVIIDPDISLNVGEYGTANISDAKETLATRYKNTGKNWIVNVDNGSFIREKDVRCTVGVGATSSKDGETAYLKYTVTFPDLIYTGEGDKLGFTVDRNADDDVDVDVDSYYNSFAITIPQCVPDKDGGSSGSDSDDKEVASAKPYIIVTNYNYGGGEVSAGQPFTLDVTFRNTSVDTAVENIVMTVACSEGLGIKNSSNTFYISELKSESELTKTMAIQVKPGVEPGSQTVDISFKYQYVADDVRSDLEMAEKIAIPVSQMDRFHADPIEMVDQVYEGEQYAMTVKYINKGRATVYNVSAEITGNIKSVGQRQNIGNVDAGKSGEIDFDVEGLGPGPVSGKVILTYEDLNMNISTVELPYNTEVVAQDKGMGGDMGMMGGMEDIPVDEGQQPVWLLVSVGAGIVLAVAAILFVRKKKAAKLVAEIEDEDETD